MYPDPGTSRKTKHSEESAHEHWLLEPPRAFEHTQNLSSTGPGEGCQSTVENLQPTLESSDTRWLKPKKVPKGHLDPQETVPSFLLYKSLKRVGSLGSRQELSLAANVPRSSQACQRPNTAYLKNRASVSGIFLN